MSFMRMRIGANAYFCRMSDEKRGGKRPGAGRKPTLNKPVKINVTFEQGTVDRVKELGFTFNTFAREATEEKLAKELKKKHEG